MNTKMRLLPSYLHTTLATLEALGVLEGLRTLHGAELDKRARMLAHSSRGRLHVGDILDLVGWLQVAAAL